MGNLQAKVGDVWLTPCGNKVEWMRTLDIGVQVRAKDVKINGEYPAVGENLPRWWPRNTKGRPMLAPRRDFTVYRNGGLIQDGLKPDETHARAYAAVMGVDWPNVKSCREVDGAIEFEMEDE